jgi:hypothetical protein
MESHAEEWQDRAVRSHVRVLLTLAWFVGSSLLLVGPGFAVWGNHATPRVLGLPWSHAWVWGIVILDFVVLVSLHTARWLDTALDGPEGHTGEENGPLGERAAAADASSTSSEEAAR